MIELTPNHFQNVAPLFAGIDHNVALVYGVIERNRPGQIFVDDPDAPASALVVSSVGYNYVGGRADQAEFNQALTPLLFDTVLPQMKEEEREIVLFAFSAAWRARLDALLRPYDAITVPRKLFAFDPKRFAAHAGWRAEIPAGFELREIDAAVAEQHPAYAPLVDPRTRRFGVALLHGDEVASACTAVSVGGGEAEIDIHTKEAYRRRGYAYLTACAFIEACLARDLTPSWACWPHRVTSQGLAKKLGFEPRPDVLAYYWAAEM